MIFKVFGYDVHKEDECPFGYDKVNDELVINEIEAEILKYVYAAEIDPTKKLDNYPAQWIEYLVQKDKECEELEKNGAIISSPVGKNGKGYMGEKTQPLIELELWSKIWKNLNDDGNDDVEESEMELNL